MRPYLSTADMDPDSLSQATVVVTIADPDLLDRCCP